MTMIRLDHNVVQSLELSASRESQEIHGTTFDFEKHFSDSEKTNFAITFSLNINTPDCHLDLVFASFFIAEDDIEEKDYESQFYTVNAPAIAYPFLRAYVANLFISSGFPTVMLPTINFVKLAEDKLINLEGENSSKS